MSLCFQDQAGMCERGYETDATYPTYGIEHDLQSAVVLFDFAKFRCWSKP